MPPPDADLYPSASGLAKATADEHSGEQDLKLFAGWFCPFVQRTWIVLEEKKIPYQYIEVNPYNKPDSLLRLNPRGLVPTLQVGPGKPLYESNVLCEYLEDHYPDHAPRLLPAAGVSGDQDYARARARIWIDYVTSRVIPAFHRFLQFQPGGAGREDEGATRLDELRAEFRGTLLAFAREMLKDGENGGAAGEGPFFLGKEISLVDIAILPWAVRLWIFDTFKGGLRIPALGERGEDEAAWARWHSWLEAVTHRESVKKTTSDQEHYMPIYKKYADDVAQSELAKATRAGRGVP